MTGSFAPARTSVRSAVRFVGGMVAVFGAGPVLFSLALMLDREGSDDPFIGQWAVNAGATISGHLGWGFGAVATVQFGVLVAIVGGQMALGDQEQEAGVRDALLLLGVLPSAALSPAMLLLVLGAIGSAEAGAALFVAVPVYLTMLAIAVFIATFQPGPDYLLLRRAQRRNEHAQDQAEALTGLPTLHPVVTAGVGGAAQTVVCVVLPIVVVRIVSRDHPPSFDPLPTLVLAGSVVVAGAMSAAMLVFASASRKPDPNRIEVVSSWVFIGLSFSVDLLLALILVLWFLPGLLGVLAVVILRIGVVTGTLRDARRVQQGQRTAGRRWTATRLVTRAGNRVAIRWADAEVVSSTKHLAAMEERVLNSGFPGQARLF
ncbi:hypothetical protein M4D54_01990 [Brachybacterium sp. p3-SID1565]|nr:hypothetical protein [Brachybacterium sp. p3-SID1565]MCT1384411.1 hypothetical protein [Brachybacterium sp. p3-SID1565]